jgi:hypothetical protein
MLLNSQSRWLLSSSTILKVSLESVVALHSTIMDGVMTSHQKPREASSPILQVAACQRPNTPLDLIRHVFVVVLLVPQRAQEVEEAIARVLSLLAERVDESSIQFHEEVMLWTYHLVGVALEPHEMLRVAGVVVLISTTGFAFEVVADVAQESETFLGRPKERMV